MLCCTWALCATVHKEKVTHTALIDTYIWTIRHFDYCVYWQAGAGLETNISENGTVISGQTGPTGQRGPPLDVDDFDRKISTRAELFHLHLDQNFQKFWRNGKHP